MNFNIESNYQNPTFGMKMSKPRFITKMLGAVSSAVGMGAVTYEIANSDKRMSAEELNGRVQVVSNPKTNSKKFNQESAFKYFAKGKLKDIPEYTSFVRNRIDRPSGLLKLDSMNTLKYQEMIVNKILSDKKLINNPNVRSHLYELVHEGFTYGTDYTEEEKQNLYKKIEDYTNARIMLLDAYAKNPKLRTNKTINASNVFTELMLTPKDAAQAEYLINALNENAVNKEFNWVAILDQVSSMELAKLLESKKADVSTEPNKTDDTEKFETKAEFCDRIYNQTHSLMKLSAGKTSSKNIDAKINAIRELKNDIEKGASICADDEYKETYDYTLASFYDKLEFIEHLGKKDKSITDDIINHVIYKLESQTSYLLFRLNNHLPKKS